MPAPGGAADGDESHTDTAPPHLLSVRVPLKKGALYSTLIRFANSYGMETEDGILISVPLTNQELANYSASARESLNRMLSELRKKGIIEMRGHLIFIKDIGYLKKAIHCENCGKDICNIE